MQLHQRADEISTRRALAEEARHRVGRPAGRIRHDYRDRTRGIGLGRRDPRHDRERGSARCQMEKSTTREFRPRSPPRCCRPRLIIHDFVWTSEETIGQAHSIGPWSAVMHNTTVLDFFGGWGSRRGRKPGLSCSGFLSTDNGSAQEFRITDGRPLR